MRYLHHLIGALIFTHCSRGAGLPWRGCARKPNLWAASGCLLLGWWSLQGLFMTPVFIMCHLRAAFLRRFETEPSEELLMRARPDLARINPDFSAFTLRDQGHSLDKRLGA